MVDDANWVHSIDGDRTLERLGCADHHDSLPVGRRRAPRRRAGHQHRAHLHRRRRGRHSVADGGRTLPRHLRAARDLCRRDPGVHRAPLAAVPARGRAALDRFLPQSHDRAAGLPRRGCAGRGDRDRRAAFPAPIRAPDSSCSASLGTPLVIAAHRPVARGSARVAFTAVRRGASSRSASGCTTWAKVSPSVRRTPPARSRWVRSS